MSRPTDNGFGVPVVPMFLNGKQPGVNVDKIDRPAGLAMLERLGWDRNGHERTFMVIDYALWRWGHGEEDQAEENAIDTSFHGIDYTSWRAVLAAACAGSNV